MITVNWLTLILGVVLPMLTALVTNQVASGGLKAVILAALSAIAGLVQALVLAGGDFGAMDWNTVGSTALTTFLLAVGAHFGLLQPLKITGSDGAIQRSVPGGVGANSPEQV